MEVIAEEIISEPTAEEAQEAELVVEVEDETKGEVQPESTEEVETVITFGDDELPEETNDAPAPDWVRDLRRQNRTQAAEIKALKQEKAKADVPPSQLSAKPTLEQADYNEARYAQSLEDWYGEKATHEKAEAAKKVTADEASTAWKSRVAEFNEAKADFNQDTIDDAVAVAIEAFSDAQQEVLIEALGKGAAPVLVGLAANEGRLKALASIKNPIRFAAEAARLETSMKTSTRRPKTSPEKLVTGSGIGQSQVKNLEKLKAEAQKSGDFTAYLKAKRLAK